VSITMTKTFTVMTCSCGVSYALDDNFIESKRESHKTFYCPNGCSLHYPSDNKEERLRVQLHNANARNSHLSDQLDSTQRSRDAYKGHATRVKNRIKKGVCPCCTRHFVNVERHMKSQHPNFTETTESGG